MLETKSSKGVLALPLMTDPIKLASVQVLSIVMVYAYGQQGSFPAILASKIVTMTLHSGLSAISSVAIACHAAIVSVLFGEVAEAHRYGQLALDLLQAFKVNE
jgi:predicted ATPase